MHQVVKGAMKSHARMLQNPFVIYGREAERPLKNGIQHSDWFKYLKIAGIENLRWHNLRHTFASQSVMKGVNLYTVSKLMGHHSLEMTECYAHLAPDFLKNAVNVLVSGNPTDTSLPATSVSPYGPVAQKDRATVS